MCHYFVSLLLRASGVSVASVLRFDALLRLGFIVAPAPGCRRRGKEGRTGREEREAGKSRGLPAIAKPLRCCCCCCRDHRFDHRHSSVGRLPGTRFNVVLSDAIPARRPIASSRASADGVPASLCLPADRGVYF